VSKTIGVMGIHQYIVCRIASHPYFSKKNYAKINGFVYSQKTTFYESFKCL
jgi:hypothetical protein